MKYFFRMVFVLLLLALAGAAWLFQEYRAPGPLSQTTTVVLDRGMGLRLVAAELKRQGVIHSEWGFIMPLLVRGEKGKVKAGEYMFSPAMSAHEVALKLIKGQVVIHEIMIPEGYTVAQVKALLMANPLLSGAIDDATPEGSLLPDTYQFLRGDERGAIIERMSRAMRDALEVMWQARDADVPLASKDEALTLASIVEKETGVADERAKVAAVYVNRLKLGMMLQADPTVAYGVERVTGVPVKALSIADLRADTPYNTYLHTGLPPGPIANPGREAILAALHPAKTEDLYFVATGNGGHNFAATMKEHEANVQKYRAAEKKDEKKR